MSVLAAVGAFNIGTGAAATTVTVSSLWPESEVPKVILFWWSGRTESTNAFGSASHLRGHGWAVGASAFRVVCALDIDGGGSADTDSGHRDDACIAMLDTTNGFGTGAGWADVQSVGNGSFTLEILDAFPTDLRVSYLAVGGSEISAATGTHTSAATGTTTVAHGLGVTPTVAFFMGACAADAPSTKVDSSVSFGAAMAAVPPGGGGAVPRQAVWSGGSNNAAASGATGTYCRRDEIFALHLSNPTTAPANLCLISNDPPGFADATNLNIDWTARNNAMRMHWLAIGGGQWAIGSLTTQTDTSTAFGTDALGFYPLAALFVSACKAHIVSGSTPSAHDEWSVGAATSASNRTCQQASSRSGNTNMFVQTGLRTDAVYLNADPDTDAIEGLGDINTWGDPITLIMDDADPAGAFMWYVAVGYETRRAKPLFLNQSVKRASLY